MLRHLDELDQECSNLHEELRGAVTSRDVLQAEVDRIQNECTQLQGRLLEEEVRGNIISCLQQKCSSSVDRVIMTQLVMVATTD